VSSSLSVIRKKIKSILAPLSPRERLIIGGVIVLAAIYLLGQGLIAANGDVGSLFRVASKQCSADSAWYSSEQASGQPSVDSGADGTKFNSSNSAGWNGTGGYLDCLGFQPSSDHVRANSSLGISVAVLKNVDQEVSDDTQSELSKVQEPGLGLNQASTETVRISSRTDPVAPNQYGQERSVSLEGLLLISVSSDKGATWTPLHTIDSSLASNKNTQISIALPDAFSADLENLAVRVEPVLSSNEFASIWIDSIFVDYELAEAQDIELSLIDPNGNKIEQETPVITPGADITAEVSSKDPDNGFFQGLASRVSNPVNKNSQPQITVNAEIVSSDGNVIVDQKTEASYKGKRLSSDDVWSFSTKMPDGTSPGKYTLTIQVTDERGGTQTIAQDFMWGVLALNSDKTVYKPGETANFAITTLDENGATVCDGEVSLRVSGPGQDSKYSTNDESIIKSDNCEVYGPDFTPDYQASHVLGGDGKYTLTLEAKTENGEFVIVDVIEVRSNDPISISRTGPTRAYPPITYPMTIEIKAEQDFFGTIEEVVPSSFRVRPGIDDIKGYDRSEIRNSLNYLAWDIDLKAGESIKLGYDFKVPVVSPAFYLLGPAKAESGGVTVFEEVRQWQIAGDAVGNMLLFWDGGAAPTGWTCVSCTGGDPFYQRFIRGDATYGATGGTATHTHTASGSVAATTTGSTEARTGTTISSTTHGHTYTPIIGTASNLPPYRQLNVIRHNTSGEPSSIPAGAIAIFDSATPTGWTRYSAQDGRYPYGENTAGSTGGSSTHSHTITGNTSTATGTTEGNRNNSTTGADAAHVHAVSANSSSVSHEPPYIETILGQKNSTGVAPDNMIAMWDDEAPINWSDQSSSGKPYHQRFIKGSVTHGSTGGSASHSHADTLGIVSGTPNTAPVNARSPGTAGATSNHTHTINVTGYSTDSNLPPYIDVYFAKKVPQPTLEQSAYRWFENDDSTDVGNPLAAQDTVAITPEQGTPFRLRAALHVGNNELILSGRDFKLQYSVRSGTCDTGFSGETYVDVGVGSGAIRYYDNSTPVNGASLTDNANDPVHSGHNNSNQTYVEANDFTNSQSSIPSGDDGLWDFSLVDHSASSGSFYCFRIVNSDNSPLDTYSQIPEITTASREIEQSTYRWFENSDSTDVGAELADQDVGAVAPAQGTPFRLRLALHVAGSQLLSSGENFKLQYAVSNGVCDVGFSGETYVDVATGSGSVRYYDNATPTDGSALTDNVNDPVHSGHTNVNQSYEESNNFTNAQAAIPAGQDGLWDFSLVDNSAPSDTSYCFRVVTSSGSTLNTYEQIPEITTAGVQLEQSAYRWFSNNDSTDVGAPLAGQDTAANAPNQGVPFRLRMNLHISSSNLSLSALDFKLQYAERSGTCDTAFSGEIFVDVETASGGVRYFDNTTPNNGDALTDNANDPVHSGHTNVNQTYVESNNFTNSQSAVNVGEDGLWDFSLVDHSAKGGTDYCFRIVRSSGANLNSYSVVAQITTTAEVIEQSVYRWFENDNSTDVGSPLAAQDTAATAPYQGNAFRLRMGLHLSDRDLAVGDKAFKLQYAARSGSCDTGFSGESYLDVAVASGAIRYFNNPAPVDGANLTPNINDPTHSGHATVGQTYEESNNFTSTSTVSIGEDGLWDFSLVDHSATPTTSYCFRIVYSDGATLDSYTTIPEITTEITVGSMLLYYDGGTVPDGWSCVSCSPGDAFYQRFIRGEASYGGTGGAASHSHTATGTVLATADAASTESRAGATVADNTHGHSYTPTIQNQSNLPSYRQLKVIRRNVPGPTTTLPGGVIGIFASAVPSGWTRYSSQDNYYVRAEDTAGNTGGSNTHAHTISGSTSAATGTTTDPRTTGGTQVGTASNTHTHTVSSTTSTVSNEPPYIETVLGKLDSAGSTPGSLVAMWDNTIPSTWNIASDTSGPFYQRFIKGAATYGSTGGNLNHSHADVTGIVSSPPVGTLTLRSGTAGTSDTHTHSINVTNFSTNDHLPPYRDVIYATQNSVPNTPSALDQVRVTASTSMSTGDWTNETQVLFEAQATDTDNPDTLSLCVEAKPIGSPFVDSEDSCGSGVTYSGSAVGVSVTITGLSSGQEYHWQARIKDADGEYSAWVSFGGNAESARDFGIDTTTPTGTVYDGPTNGVDIEFNNGSLDQLSANWVINFANSGQAGDYEYSVGTTPGGTEVSSWTTTSATSVTATGLTLNTLQPYYFNIRATDNAGNQAVISSDGQFVAPMLSFSTSPAEVNVGDLNAGNNFTSTAQTTLTTSTNAYNGYIIRGFAEALLKSENNDTIGMFSGGDYSSPNEWLPGDTGYGYHSSDTLVNGINRYNSGPCAGGGNPPCFAPWSMTFPGDIIADHTSLISGIAVTNEQFTITHRVTTGSDQPSGQYRSTIIYAITARY